MNDGARQTPVARRRAIRPSSPEVSARMSRLGRRDTAPEVALRRELHARGLRFRVDRAVVPGVRTRADIVFGPAKVAVYVDGCFWHGCPTHGTMPAANQEFWREKLERNRRRDRLVDQTLAEAGWTTVRVWEHESPADAADRVVAALRARDRKVGR